MKPRKVLCCRFLFAFLGVDRAQNLAKYNRRLRVFMLLTNRNIAITLFMHIVFIRLNAAAFIKFFVIQVRRLFEGGVYLKSNLFLANNSMVIEPLN